MVQDSQTTPRIVEVDVNTLSEIVGELLVISSIAPFSLSKEESSVSKLQSKDSYKHGEELNMQQRYQTRGTNRSWSWKKAARARSEFEGVERKLRVESSRSATARAASF